MSTTPKLGLMTTTVSDNPRFKDWRMALAGDAAGSNMMLIDAAVGAAQDWQEDKNITPFTWGMLKFGFEYTGE